MKRRTLLCAMGAMLGLPAFAQPARLRIGCLWIGREDEAAPFVNALAEGLREHGYVLGRNLSLEHRYANVDVRRLPSLADELIALKPDLLVGVETAGRVLRAKTSSIPIVLLSSSDPVAAGLVHALARPGTNVTGMADLWSDLVGKHIDLLGELVPTIKRVALINDASSHLRDGLENAARATGRAKGLSVVVVSARDAQSVGAAFGALRNERVDALLVPSTIVFFSLLPEIAAGAQRLRLPSIYGLARYPEVGGLASYGANLLESHRHAATFINRIAKGAKPADIPVQQPSKLELVLNLKTARAMRVTIPRSVLARADRVIQ